MCIVTQTLFFRLEVPGSGAIAAKPVAQGLQAGHEQVEGLVNKPPGSSIPRMISAIPPVVHHSTKPLWLRGLLTYKVLTYAKERRWPPAPKEVLCKEIAEELSNTGLDVLRVWHRFIWRQLQKVLNRTRTVKNAPGKYRI